MTDYPLLLLFAVVMFAARPWRGTTRLVSLAFVLLLAFLLAAVLATNPGA